MEFSDPLTFQCDDKIQTEYSILAGSVSSVLCIFGFMYAFFGYRCFKAVLFLSGFIFGTSVVYLICREERIFDQKTSIQLAVGVSIIVGIFCGFITMLIRSVGLFLQGFFLGVLVSIAIITCLVDFYHPSTLWITFSILFFAGVFFSFLTLKFEKNFIIIGTSLLGSGLIITCIDYFIQNFKLLLYIWEQLMGSNSNYICWYSWVIFGVWFLLTLIGIIVQYKVTGKGYHHTDVIVRGRRKRVRTHLIRASRSTTQPPVAIVQSNRSNRIRSSNQQPAPRPQDDATSCPPPSYEECIENGICKRLSDSSNHRPIRRREISQAETFAVVNEAFRVPDTRPILASNQHRGSSKTRRSDVVAAHAQRLLAAENQASCSNARSQTSQGR